MTKEKVFSLSILCFLFFPFSIFADLSEKCTYSPDDTLSINIDGCVPSGLIETEGDDYTLEGGIKARFTQIANNLIILGGLLTVGGIAYGGLGLVLSGGDEAKLKTSQSQLIWSCIGFVTMLLAYPVVNAVINFIYTLIGQSG